MNNERKTEILLQYDNLIKKLCYSYRIFGFTKEELMQEVRTHIAHKLDDFDETLSRLEFYIPLVIKNKLNNMFKSPKNQKDYPVGVVKDEEIFYTEFECDTLQLAFELLDNHEHKDLIFDKINGYTFRELEKKYGVSKSTAHRIYDSFLKSVRNEL